MPFDDRIKQCLNLTVKLPKYAYKSMVIKLKLDKDPLQNWVYLLSFINSLKILLDQFSEAYMLLMDYPYIRGG